MHLSASRIPLGSDQGYCGKVFAAPGRLPQANTPPTATLMSDVVITSELACRPASHAPDYAREIRALGDLAKELSENPRNMLQRLTEVALELCRADSAGVSLLEDDVFRWEGLAGAYASYRDSTMPRSASPCGVCIDEGRTQLMYLPDRCFPALFAEPRFVEALLIPFAVQGENIGTVWVVAHTEDRKFDAEDERIVRALANFAAAGWQQWKAREVAETSNHHKDEFLAMLGHELRNPLSAIVAATSILERSDGATDAITVAVEVLGRQSRHLSRMVDDLTDLARIAQGKLGLRLERVEVGMVIKDALTTAASRIERRHQRLTVESLREPVYLRADPARVTQVVANLLDNAAKYTPEGGDIRLVVELDDGTIQFRVQDTGIGIPQERLRGFSIFSRRSKSSGLRRKVWVWDSRSSRES
jgi:hypothetical protein